ncbi:MAG: DNA repair protein RecO [Sebaldella sp.]|nr:DNA repair protein RecO [Sebaldella sp.]
MEKQKSHTIYRTLSKQRDMNIIKSEGIVIKKTDVGEADVVLKVFTKEFGKIDIYVNGIRKSKNREKISVELMSISEFLIYEKNSKYVSNSFTIKTFFSKVSLDYSKLNFSYYILHLIDKIYEYNSEDKEFYDKIVNSFEYINNLDGKNEILLYYLVLFLLKSIILNHGIYDYENILEEVRSADSREKIEDILNNDSRDVLQQGKYTKDEIREMIVHLEKYINHNLNMNLKFEFFI